MGFLSIPGVPMKKKPIAFTLLLAAALSISLTGCGDDGVEILEKRVVQGRDAKNAVEGLNNVNQQQSDEVSKYLDE